MREPTQKVGLRHLSCPSDATLKGITNTYGSIQKANWWARVHNARRECAFCQLSICLCHTFAYTKFAFAASSVADIMPNALLALMNGFVGLNAMPMNGEAVTELHADTSEESANVQPWPQKMLVRRLVKYFKKYFLLCNFSMMLK